MAGHPREEQDATWQAITDAVQERSGADGRVSFENVVLFAAGSA
jgi:hypothetical protein